MNTTIKRIDNLINQVKSLPDTDKDDELFQQNKNYKSLLLNYFTMLKINCEKHPHILKKVELADLSGTPLEVKNRIDAPTSPIRNALILLSVGLK